MKTFVYFACLFLVITSCTRNDDPTFVVTRSEWYLERIFNNGGAVHLLIEGATTGDKVTIRTAGDGLVSERNLELDSKKHFCDDIIISFSVTGVPTGEFVSGTELKFYKKGNVITQTLTSGKLKY